MTKAEATTKRDELNRQLHKDAVSEAMLHGKRILPADSEKDTTYAFIGGGLGGFAVLCGCRLLGVHSEVARLLLSAAGFCIGFVLGHAAFNYFFVKDESWQPPPLDHSWNEYRVERSRWMRGGTSR